MESNEITEEYCQQFQIENIDEENKDRCPRIIGVTPKKLEISNEVQVIDVTEYYEDENNDEGKYCNIFLLIINFFFLGNLV